MTQGAQPTLAPSPESELVGASRKSRSLWNNAWRQFRRQRTAVFGMVMLIIIVAGVLVFPFLSRQDPNAMSFDHTRELPSWAHPFGTNDLGQDQFRRAMAGGRISLAVGLSAMAVGIFLGSLIGALSGYFGGVIDSALSRVTELFLSLPTLPVLMMTIYLFRDPLRRIFGLQVGIFLLIVVLIGAFNWMAVARIVRAQFLSLKEKEFVEAAHCLGVPTRLVITRHILPNVLSPVIVAATLSVGAAITTEATLSFLGLGFPPDFPTWGRMIFDAQDYLTLSPHMAIAPAMLIFLTVLSINYVGDGLRDALDPRMTS